MTTNVPKATTLRNTTKEQELAETVNVNDVNKRSFCFPLRLRSTNKENPVCARVCFLIDPQINLGAKHYLDWFGAL